MNKCNLYILTLLTSLLVACAQQNEASYQNDVSDESAMVEESLVEPPYYWEEDDLESFDEMDSYVADEEQINSNQPEEEISDQQKDLGGLETEKNELDNVSNKESKLIKAFVKQNIADLFDLGALYIDETNSKQMRIAIKSEMMQVLANGDFPSFENSLFFNSSSNKKLSFEKIEITEDGNYVGVIQIISKSKSNRIAFKVSSETLDYGVSRKFEILGIAY